MARFAKTIRVQVRVNRILESKLDQLARFETRKRQEDVAASTIIREIVEQHIDELLQPHLAPTPALQTA